MSQIAQITQNATRRRRAAQRRDRFAFAGPAWRLAGRSSAACMATRAAVSTSRLSEAAKSRPPGRSWNGLRPVSIPAPVIGADASAEPGHEVAPLEASSQSALAQQDAAAESGFKNVVCITLYNEPFELLRSSLSALIFSIGAQRTSAPAQAARSCVVIIADGRNRIDPQIMRFFTRAGVIDTGRSFSALGETSISRGKRIDEVMTRLGVAGDLMGEIDFAVCVKDRKSRQAPFPCAVFPMDLPRAASRALLSARCRDRGRAGAVSKLVAYMDERPDVAAAASRILTPTPGDAASTLSVWQYMDFVMQKAVTWPTEVASGT